MNKLRLTSRKSKQSTRKQYYSLQSFLSYMKQYKLRFAAVVLSFMISDFALAIMPEFIGKLIGSLAAHPVQGHQAVIWVWVLIGLSTAHNILWRISEFLHMKLILPLSFQYENILFRQIIRKPYPYFVDKFTGKVSSYNTTISQEMRMFFDDICYNYASQTVSLVTVVAILTSINWQTGAIFVAAILGMLIVGRYTIRNSARYEKNMADVQSTKNGKIIDTIANFVNVKSFQREAAEIKSIGAEQNKTIASAKKSQFWAIFFWGSMSFFVRDVIWPATIGLNVYLFLHHEISISQLATLLSSVLIFSSNIWQVIWYVAQFNLKLARVEEAHTYLFGNVNIFLLYLQDGEQASEPRTFTSELTLQKLHFAYPDKPAVPVLNAINLKIKKGEKLGIVGKSGSGKTTLTKLLLGYYPAAKNQIVLDGNPIDTRQLAQLISYVPQDTSLFHRTVGENIAYASDTTTNHTAIVAAAKRAHAHEFITQIDDGYDALVGERGVKLSAGQRQRIAIARAFLDDKPLLILDEATSALDSESEVLVQEALEALWAEKTVIAIAHRLSTLRHMDRILVIDNGTIIEQGSHEELLKHKGAYAKLWNHQSGGFIDEQNG